eukprot:1410691-Rhodomonas_salina.1
MLPLLSETTDDIQQLASDWRFMAPVKWSNQTLRLVVEQESDANAMYVLTLSVPYDVMNTKRTHIVPVEVTLESGGFDSHIQDDALVVVDFGNNPPSFALSRSAIVELQTSVSNNGLYRYSGLATDILPGPLDAYTTEQSQQVTFDVNVSYTDGEPPIFVNEPTMTANGELSFRM